MAAASTTVGTAQITQSPNNAKTAKQTTMSSQYAAQRTTMARTMTFAQSPMFFLVEAFRDPMSATTKHVSLISTCLNFAACMYPATKGSRSKL